jgi:crotonobetainyl-CoA:carnitine CoA-transferase CaiB-like acyl-CoA transferase
VARLRVPGRVFDYVREEVMKGRARHVDDVYRLAGETLATKTTAEWLALFDELEIPAGPVNGLTDLAEDPHLKAIGFFRRVAHPSEGDLVMPDAPLRFSDSPAAITRLPPRFGEHGREILGELGISGEEIEALAAAGGVVLPKL